MALGSGITYNKTFTPSTDGVYNFKFYSEDGSGNAVTLNSTLTYTESTFTSTSGGGGGGDTTIINQLAGCGDGTCDAEAGETRFTCPIDCKSIVSTTTFSDIKSNPVIIIFLLALIIGSLVIFDIIGFEKGNLILFQKRIPLWVKKR